jgi:hypothetical protein
VVGATYHEEGLGDSVFGEEKDVDAVDTKHPHGGGSDKRSSSVEFEKSRRVGESEGDDENSKLAMTIREDTNIAKKAQKDRANGENGVGLLLLFSTAFLRVRSKTKHHHGEEEVEPFLQRLEEEASEERPQIVDDLVDTLVVHGGGAQTEEIALPLRQQLLQTGLFEEDEEEALGVAQNGNCMREEMVDYS